MTPSDNQGTREEWLAARTALLAREKELTRLRDDLAQARRQLPLVEIDKDYRFAGSDGEASLLDLFDGQQQLIVQHFMFGPGWEEGCPSCSFWVDAFNGTEVHLEHRDTRFVLVSRAELGELEAYRTRMGWNVPWYSSAGSDFNFDFGVSFTADQQESGGEYNFAHQDQLPDELPGVSTFARDGDRVFHTYSTYARGLDTLNPTYQLLDLTSMGRHEDDLEWDMAWLRRHDQYD
ncbi:MAG: DUF899 domain-containing protein [Microthrixaceae bacterium]